MLKCMNHRRDNTARMGKYGLSMTIFYLLSVCWRAWWLFMFLDFFSLFNYGNFLLFLNTFPFFITQTSTSPFFGELLFPYWNHWNNDVTTSHTKTNTLLTLSNTVLVTWSPHLANQEHTDWPRVKVSVSVKPSTHSFALGLSSIETEREIPSFPLILWTQKLWSQKWQWSHVSPCGKAWEMRTMTM